MIYEREGRIVKGLGGLFEVRICEGDEISLVSCRAKGNLKRDDEKLLVGDRVKVLVDTDTPDSLVISSVIERENSLIRPPMANLNYLFVVLAAKKPSPVLETVDKLIAICEHNNIRPVVVITKADLDSTLAGEYYDIYNRIGIPTFLTSSTDRIGLDELSLFVRENIKEGKTAAFAGASGVGKSTLLNALFPHLSLATSDISKRIERGKHTTRHVELYPIEESTDSGFLADTPGFSLIDFERFDFFSLEDLIPTFPEFLPYIGACRYQDCAHVGEGKDECAIARAVEEGIIPETRLSSYRSIYRILKAKKNQYE